MKIAKFMFKFNNQMLPHFFNNYFTKLDNVHNYLTMFIIDNVHNYLTMFIIDNVHN